MITAITLDLNVADIVAFHTTRVVIVNFLAAGVSEAWPDSKHPDSLSLSFPSPCQHHIAEGVRELFHRATLSDGGRKTIAYPIDDCQAAAGFVQLVPSARGALGGTPAESDNSNSEENQLLISSGSRLSMKSVDTFPDTKSLCFRQLMRNCVFVLTPSISTS